MINHVTVIGSGLMGAGIAAHLTNAGVNVLLLDIPDVSSENRNNFADLAVKKLSKIKPSPLSLASNTNLIETGNIDDHLHLIKNSDWVIEVIIEDLNIKFTHSKTNIGLCSGCNTISRKSKFDLILYSHDDKLIQKILLDHLYILKHMF